MHIICVVIIEVEVEVEAEGGERGDKINSFERFARNDTHSFE